MAQNLVVGWLGENWIAFSVVGVGAVAYYKIEKALGWKNVLFNKDGSLNYILRKEYEKDMTSLELAQKEKNGEMVCQDTLKLTKTEHEQLCKIASLEMASAFGAILDARFEHFEQKLFKALKLNGYGDR
jgi:hypothetical protein